MKKFLEKYISLIIFFGLACVAVITLFIGGFVRDIHNNSLREKGRLSCFVSGGIKCGNLDATKEEIIKNLNSFDLSLNKMEELFLKAQENSKNKISELNEKDVLTKNEESMKQGMELSQPYYEKVLEIIKEKKNE